MSSEENPNCCGVIENKLLQNKVKRTRQRVDAGEPRNSYSSIPNFSSRPSFLSSGLYSAIFNPGQKHFGFFGPGFAPAKMLNELLNRQVKTGSEASSPVDSMIAVDASNSESKMNLDCLKSPAIMRQSLDEESRQSSQDEMAHNMLRDILQGRKKELLALENELRSVSANGVKPEPLSLENNNTINNNNNNNLNNNNVKIEYKKGALSDVIESDIKSSSVGEMLSLNESDGLNVDSDNISVDQENSTGNLDESPCETRVKTEDALSTFNSNVCSDSEASIPSPLSETKEDADTDVPYTKSPEPRPQKTGQIELKRARVENIVSTMRSSPTLPIPVNGCKKRKLYHPQQHDISAAERYSDNGLSNNGSLGTILDDEDSEPPELRQKLVEKNALKTQLRSMQEQLAEMQHKYVQLCNRMEQESECPDQDDVDPDADVGSDTEPEVRNSSSEKPGNSSAAPAFPFSSTPTTQTSSSPSIPNLISSKLHSLNAPLNPDSHLLLPNMNGPLSMVQNQHLPHSDHPNNSALHYGQHGFSNAAAMYLGVNHKLFFDQESKVSKSENPSGSSESQHHHHHHHHHHQSVSQSKQELKAQQKTLNLSSNLSHSSQSHLNSGHSQSSSSNHHVQNIQSEIQNRLQSPQKRSSSEFSERLSMFRNTVSGVGPVTGTDLEGLADVLKTEITSSLTNLIDTIINRFVQQKRLMGKQTETASVAAEQLNKDLMLASQLLDRKSPRTKVIDRTPSASGERLGNSLSSGTQKTGPTTLPIPHQQTTPISTANSTPANTPNSEIASNSTSVPVRPSPSNSMFQAPKLPSGGINPAAAAALYSSISGIGVPNTNPLCLSTESRDSIPEQNEALSLVVAPKKKRHKVTDTRITPRTVSRILAQDNMGPSPSNLSEQTKQFNNIIASTSNNSGAESPPPRLYHPPSMLPVSLPTSVAIPNPSLHESQVFSPYSPFFHQHQSHHINGSPPVMVDHRDSPPLTNPPTILHPALLAAAHHSGTPDFVHFRGSSGLGDCGDRGSEGNSGDGPFDGLQPSISFYYTNEKKKEKKTHDKKKTVKNHSIKKKKYFLNCYVYSSTLTPMHLRKAKLMFFWVRYPSSAVLKMYFPDIMFNKNNTAQLVKWFSNFREFYYIQMEKYARQAVSEGIKNAEDIHVSADSEIYRVLNLHYNRNNHIEVPSNFRFVVEQTLREFFKAIQTGKDTEQSWKKSIYKIISRMDDPVPDYFKSPNFLEQLE
ncbi:homeobox protein prospero/prox-1/ceh-26, putative [Pediculus humanus corporis]|uniref:Homeobox protein prospero n=2 Tax=Anoplura TaxID=30005 RepID=E0VNH4_PEDHC|nr:homeobox protein prospero/prox-1/ceh-26, putative [Pediculus humanus corporis]EEB14930.1 homeobox protein prospero/prox-1/ceh-26, putative [Pediculus humanus corporis]